MNERIAAFNKRQETFIMNRSHYENVVNTWCKSLGNLPEEEYKRITSAIPITKDTTLKDLVPEWWEQVPNKERASEQVRQLNHYLEMADSIVLQIIEEGEKADAEARRLIQGDA